MPCFLYMPRYWKAPRVCDCLLCDLGLMHVYVVACSVCSRLWAVRARNTLAVKPVIHAKSVPNKQRCCNPLAPAIGSTVLFFSAHLITVGPTLLPLTLDGSNRPEMYIWGRAETSEPNSREEIITLETQKDIMDMKKNWNAASGNEEQMRQRMQTTNQILLAAEKKEGEKTLHRLVIIVIIITTNTWISRQQTLDLDLTVHYTTAADWEKLGELFLSLSAMVNWCTAAQL